MKVEKENGMQDSLRDFLYSTDDKENREMLCNICNRYLSIPPILHNNILGNICGRCEGNTEVSEIKKLGTKDSIMERQKVFEAIARYLKFPCSFRINGCDAELRWGEVDEHEFMCTFKHTHCFLSNRHFLEEDQESCNWTGEPSELVSHFYAKHNIYITTSLRIVLGLEASSIFGPLFGTDSITYEPKFQSKIFCTEIFGSVVIIVLCYEQCINTYFCQVFTDLSNHRCNSLEYQLEIFDEHKKHSIVLPKATVQSMRNYFWPKSTQENGLEIDLNYINKLLKMPHFITADFRLLKKNSMSSLRTLSLLRTVLSNNPLYDENTMPDMKCYLCGSYLSGSIYFCSSGHNVCEECKSSDECCDYFSDYRNLALEKWSLLLKFACKNKALGCSYIATRSQVTDHEKICHFVLADRKCFFRNCSSSSTNFLTHIKEKHTMIVTNEIYNATYQRCYFSFDEDIFALEMNLKVDEYFTYSVICCGTAELKYRYEIQLMDVQVETKTNAKLIINQVCQPEYALLQHQSRETIVPFELLPQFFSNSVNLMFKINVFPIFKS